MARYYDNNAERRGETFLYVTGLGIVGALCIAFMGDPSSETAKKEEKPKIENSYVLQEKDLNGNNIPEKFYEIDGKKVFLEVDGESLEGKLNK